MPYSEREHQPSIPSRSDLLKKTCLEELSAKLL